MGLIPKANSASINSGTKTLAADALASPGQSVAPFSEKKNKKKHPKDIFPFKSDGKIKYLVRIRRNGLKVSKSYAGMKDAIRFRDKIIADHRAGLQVFLPKQVTFNELSRQFLKDELQVDPDEWEDPEKRKKIRETHENKYIDDEVRKVNWLSKYFPGYMVDKIRSVQIEGCRTSLRKNGTCGEKISKKTVKDYLDMLHRILNFAERREHINKAPDKKSFEVSHAISSLREGEVMQETKFREFFNAAGKKDRQYFLFLFIAGKRDGEIRGLATDKNHYDLDKRRRLAYIIKEEEEYFLEVKRDSATKKPSKIPLCRIAQIILNLVVTRADQIFVFEGSDPNRPMSHPDGVFKTILKRICLTNFRIHDLRHTIKTWFDDLGTPNAVSEAYSGRYRKGIDQWYSHAGQNRLKKASEAMQQKVLDVLGLTLQEFEVWINSDLKLENAKGQGVAGGKIANGLPIEGGAGNEQLQLPIEF